MEVRKLPFKVLLRLNPIFYLYLSSECKQIKGGGRMTWQTRSRTRTQSSLVPAKTDIVLRFYIMARTFHMFWQAVELIATQELTKRGWTDRLDGTSFLITVTRSTSLLWGKGKYFRQEKSRSPSCYYFLWPTFPRRHRHTRTRAIKEVLPSITRQHTTITATFGTRYACFLSERQAGTNELRKPNDVE